MVECGRIATLGNRARSIEYRRPLGDPQPGQPRRQELGPFPGRRFGFLLRNADEPHALAGSELREQIKVGPDDVGWSLGDDVAEVEHVHVGADPQHERDVVVEGGEAGGIWALDRASGQFLWATPFPLDVPEFHISDIDVDTGRTHINWNSVMKKDKDRILVCFHNTRGYWSTAYHPGKNALYIPYHDACLDMTANSANPQGWGPRRAVMRPGSDPKTFSANPLRLTRIKTVRGHNEIYVFALPEKR